MEEINTIKQTGNNQPSLLRQIVDAADALDEVQQFQLLLQLRKDEILAGTKALDEKLQENALHFTEDEIAEVVSNDRRENYEKKIRN